MGIRFGVFVPQGWRTDLIKIKDPVEKYEAMTRVAQAADNGPWDSIWVYDHFHTVPTPLLEATFECWTITSTLVRDTKRVRVGQMVACNGYRNPALYAKIASTVDVASHGRLNAGIGAGWHEQEWRAYGYGFPELRERMGMLKEACEIIHRMWTEDDPVFQGKYYTIDRPINQPKGVQKPHPPLWIGGSGERVTLKLVAQFGDACNLEPDPEVVRRKLGVLREHCEALGRNYDEIVKSVTVEVFPIAGGEDAERATARARSYESFRTATLVADSGRQAARLEQLIEAGINYFIIYVPGVAYDHEPMQRFEAEVIPKVAASTPVKA
jgi:F420-dependent oxidoreductase-like protein